MYQQNVNVNINLEENLIIIRECPQCQCQYQCQCKKEQCVRLVFYSSANVYEPGRIQYSPIGSDNKILIQWIE